MFNKVSDISKACIFSFLEYVDIYTANILNIDRRFSDLLQGPISVCLSMGSIFQDTHKFNQAYKEIDSVQFWDPERTGKWCFV